MKHGFPILLVEDNPVSLKLIEKTLLKAGHDVTTAANGRQALELFNEKFFPVVLTDWMMPEMDGLDLCRAVRARTVERYVYIIILTARDSKDDIVTGLKAGADDYLSKPISHSELMARLNTGIRILELEKSLKAANEEISSLHADCLTKWVKQFRLGTAINRCFECSVFRGSVFRRGGTIRRDSAGRFSSEFDNSGRPVPTNGERCCGRLCC